MPEDMGEKTELPSGRKLAEARSHGQIAKSADLAAGLDLSGAIVACVVFGALLIRTLSGGMRHVLQSVGDSITADSAAPALRTIALLAGFGALPILGGMMLVAALAHLLQVGPLFTTEPLQPKFDRLNPVAGLARLFNKRSLVKTLVNSLKLAVVCAIAYRLIDDAAHQLVALPRLDLWPALDILLRLIARMAIWLVALLLVIGAADYFYQRWQHTQDLRMTKQEVEDERKSMEGDPEIKRRRMKMARQLALQRVSQAVPRADVIVTNPTHFSVALQYDQETMRAPRVVAKGVDDMAMRIRVIAREHRIPIVERPPLARGLYWGTEVGQEIDAEFYQAVAEVLAYVYRIEQQAVAA